MNIKTLTKIFIVEDNNVFAQALKADIESTFINLPMQIQIFETGEKCMEKFKEEKPNIVILDFHLNSNFPNAQDGIKVLDYIKKDENETYVIILTSNDHLEIALKAFHHGASDYVVKTDTKFRKINFSLLNFFNLIEAKNDIIKYKKELNEYKENSKS